MLNNSIGIGKVYNHYRASGDRTRWALQWRHNERDGVSIHQPHDCLLNRLFRRKSKKTSKLRVTGLCVGIHRSLPTQRVSQAENISIWWGNHVSECRMMIISHKYRLLFSASVHWPFTNIQCTLHSASPTTISPAGTQIINAKDNRHAIQCGPSITPTILPKIITPDIPWLTCWIQKCFLCGMRLGIRSR